MSSMDNSSPGKRLILRILLTTLILFILIFAGFKAKDLVLGPQIIITSPQNGALLTSPLITIEGKALRIAFITLNDRQIFVNEQGTIREQLLLQNGYTILSLKATDRFNRKVEKRLELIYKKPN